MTKRHDQLLLELGLQLSDGSGNFLVMDTDGEITRTLKLQPPKFPEFIADQNLAVLSEDLEAAFSKETPRAMAWLPDGRGYSRVKTSYTRRVESSGGKWLH